MATFEKKVSEIFGENPRLARKIPVVIRKIFQESESEFKRRLRKEPEEEQEAFFSKLFDALYMDFFFESLNDRFMNWVIENHPQRFTNEELEEMRAQSLSHLDFYEVQQVYPGKGCDIQSILTREKGFLRDISSSSSLLKWDIFLARCYRFRGDYLATGALALFRPHNKQFIIDKMEEALLEEGEVAKSSYAAFAKKNWDIFYQIEREIRERAMSKKFYTKYGELKFCEVRFQVHDIDSILETIDTADEFNFIEIRERRLSKKKGKIERYQFDWFSLGIEEKLKPIETPNIEDGVVLSTSQLDAEGNQLGIEVIGNLYVDRFLCRLETRSLELAEFSVDHFSRLFGDALTFKRIIEKKMNAPSQGRNREASSKPADTAPSDPKITKKVIEKYYLDLLDEKIPQLNNMSPREARQDSAAHPMLIEWLKGLENMLARNQQNGELFISIKKIKKELDLDW